jgi:repressor LexA
MEELTKRQLDVLTVIKKFYAENNMPPTIREIAKKLNLSSPATIFSHLKKLEEKKYIKTGSGKSRSIELLVDNEFKQDEDLTSVPLLGKTSAGDPIEAIENPDEYFDVPNSLIPLKKEIFALKVEGDSMINKGFYDGDVVLIERKNSANNGDVVVAMTDEFGVTLKTFYQEKNHFRLQPENDLYEPIILPSLSILGKAIGLYRKL